MSVEGRRAHEKELAEVTRELKSARERILSLKSAERSLRGKISTVSNHEEKAMKAISYLARNRCHTGYLTG